MLGAEIEKGDVKAEREDVGGGGGWSKVIESRDLSTKLMSPPAPPPNLQSAPPHLSLLDEHPLNAGSWMWGTQGPSGEWATKRPGNA